MAGPDLPPVATSGTEEQLSAKHRARGDARRLLAPVTATLLAILGLSLLGIAAASQQAAPPQVPSATAPVVPLPTAEPGADAGPDTARPAPRGDTRESPGTLDPGERAAAPTRLRVPSIGVDTSLLHLGLDEDGVLEVPADPDLVGWFSWGTPPGDVGAAVMAGHVDSPEGRGVFFELAELEAGAEIVIDRADGTTAVFHVERVVHYPKDDLPTVEVYASTGRELRLITCGGDWDGDTNSYRDNIVAYATLVDSTG